MEAQADIEDAVEWYEGKSAGLGGRFLDDLFNQLRYLSHYPEHFPQKKNALREVNLKSFPYLVIYEFEQEEITVWAVFNTWQNPLKKP